MAGIMTPFETQKMLRDLIEFYGVILEKDLPGNISGVQLLGAIAENESSFGSFRVAKHEAAFDQGGKYFDRELWTLWGSNAACSYSSFQMMFSIAVREYGLSKEVAPWEFNIDQVALPYVMKYIKRKIASGADTVDKILDAYNSGSYLDVQTDHVKQYIQRGLQNYLTVRTMRGLKGGRVVT